MSIHISWKVFTEGIIVLVGIYYLVIFPLFYRKEIGALLRGSPPGFPARDGIGDKPS